MLAARHHYTLASCVSPTSGIVSPLPSVIISCCPRKVLAYCHQKFLYTTTTCSCPSSMTLTNIWPSPLSCVPFYHYLQSSDVEAKSIGRFPKASVSQARRRIGSSAAARPGKAISKPEMLDTSPRFNPESLQQCCTTSQESFTSKQ